ncbi:MAG TPA: SDR family oxidoreductase [Noviherbaspirillum sp.]|uniref:SDR family oxidoreductase n=1 Tax=Noviherbaspirillum sp. TaxID=1926288 RepID=UPI002B46B2EB|nr:SDR family oxidoreductase [Noviherbaspirillum sp.]HJV84572.1 SDR family oxidoreductase [Noviherbaspirillum sp.]
MSERLKDKVVLITGAASGIGAQAARQFVAEGARVVISDVNIDAGSKLARELGATFVTVDVSVEGQVRSAVSLAVEQHGRLDCMINNAGMVGAVGSILDTRADDWHRTLSVLLDSVFYGIKHAGAQMRRQGSGGSIISLSSLAGVAGGVGPHAYSVAKAGVIALTRGAASELAQYGIRVNAVAPGLVVTPLVDKVYGGRDKAEQGAVANSPLGSAAMPEEIAEALCYLASDEARHVNAHTLVVDSGVSVAGSSASAQFHARPAGFLGTMPKQYQ